MQYFQQTSYHLPEGCLSVPFHDQNDVYCIYFVILRHFRQLCILFVIFEIAETQQKLVTSQQHLIINNQIMRQQIWDCTQPQRNVTTPLPSCIQDIPGTYFKGLNFTEILHPTKCRFSKIRNQHSNEINQSELLSVIYPLSVIHVEKIKKKLRESLKSCNSKN